MNAKRRGSYLSEKKGNVLSGFIKEAGFASSLATTVRAKPSNQGFFRRATVFR
jgi:hypothetical protein